MTTPDPNPQPPVPPLPSRIGIMMMSALGDAVHVLPVVNALKRHASDTHIAWVLAPGPASLVRGHPSVDEIVVFDKKKGMAAYGEVRRALAGRLDLLLALQVYFKAGILTALLDAPVKLGFDRARARDMNWLATNRKIPPHAPQHVQDQYFEFLAALGVPAGPASWSLGPWPQEQDAARRFVQPIGTKLVTLVIGASHPEKEWLPDRWAKVADTLHGMGFTVVLAGGKSPRELATEAVIRAEAKHQPVSTLGCSLRELVWLLAASSLVISLDTGPLHMSVALDRPVISLMGYNNPRRVGPYRKFQDLVVDAYGEPGEHYPISMAHRLGRMPRITVDDVMRKVDLWKLNYAAV